MTPTISEGKVLDALYYLEQKRYILKSPMEAGVQIVLIKDFSEYEELYNEKQRLKRRRKRYKLSEGIGSVC